MQPDAQLDPLLSTPDVQQVFIQAQSEAQASGCAGGGGTGVVPPPSQVGFAPSSGGPQVEDVECPPGVVCGAEDDGIKNTEDEFARWFVNLQFAMGFGFVQPGMPTDSKPDASEIFLDGPLGNSAIIRNNMDGLPGHQQAVEFDMDMPDVPIRWEDRFLFDDTSGWVPDADSFDDYEEYDANGNLIVPRATTPVSTQCEADGTETGPGSVQGRSFSDPPGTPPSALPPEPSSYCVRVAASGFVPGLALRLTPGYFITESFALSLPLRFQLDSSGGAFGKIQLGLRGELLFSEMDSATGFPVSWFFGASYGKIEVKPPPKDPSREVPWVVGGPLGLNTGVNIRYRIVRNFGVIVAPEVDVYLPDLLLNLEISIGAEAAF
jgi:hypothetical protein